MKIIQWILNLLYPPKCILCRRLLNKDQQDLCSPCRNEANFYDGKKTSLQFLDSVTAVWYYEGNVRSSLLRYKFYGARYYACGYGRLLAERLRQEHPEGFDILTWVPVSDKRRKKRGYDQVELIAHCVGRELNQPVMPTLKKVRDNPPQSGMESEALRRANVAGVYACLDNVRLSGKRILLLDDIVTTGSTSGEAARMLRSAGAEEVHFAAIAATRK